MATILWEKELNEPGIVAEMRTESGVRVFIHNGAYFGKTRAEKEARKREAFRVAQEIVNRAYIRNAEQEKLQ